jgi:uncharacterized membrane protein
MKASPVTYLAIITVLLVAVAIFTALGFPLRSVFYLTVLGQILLIFTIVKVLKNNYTTDKTFDDFYEDFPIKKED